MDPAAIFSLVLCQISLFNTYCRNLRYIPLESVNDLMGLSIPVMVSEVTSLRCVNLLKISQSRSAFLGIVGGASWVL